MRMIIRMIAKATVIAIPLFVAAYAEHLPFPRELMVYSKVYIVDAVRDRSVYDHLYTGFQKWGRFEIVRNQNDAEIVAVYTDRESIAHVWDSGRRSGTESESASEGDTPETRVAVRRRNQRYLHLVDIGNQKRLLTVQCEQRMNTSDTADALVNRLRKRVEQGEKELQVKLGDIDHEIATTPQSRDYVHGHK